MNMMKTAERCCTWLGAALALSLTLTPTLAAESAEDICSAVPKSEDGQAVQVGEEVMLSLDSPAVTLAGKEEQLVWSEEIQDPEGAYIAPHFDAFQLPEGARLVVRSPEGERSWEYTGSGQGEGDGFWGIHIHGDTAIVELYSSVSLLGGEVSIDSYARGYDLPMDFEALCGTDDSAWAKCYQTSHPQVYNSSRAVARLLIGGTSLCTGWLVGSDGHLMTNNHCISNASEANSTTVEFMAEGATCGTNCASALGCPGTVVATSTTYVQSDFTLDYALVKLPTNPTTTYGFLQMRDRGTAAGERIYIPQHPAGWGKKIALFSTHSDDETGFCQVESTTRPPCSGGAGNNDVGYWCDTQGGSSGSPVLGLCDHVVLALHHCGSCPNRGVPIEKVIRELRDAGNLPPNSIASTWGCGDCGPGYCDGTQYCDDLGCYPAGSPLSRAICECGWLAPQCGIGGCVGDSYCDGANCQYPVCWIDTYPGSQVMCQGREVDAACNVI